MKSTIKRGDHELVEAPARPGGDDRRESERPRLAGVIEHTVLDPCATVTQVEQACDEALEHGFCGVCVAPFHVAAVAQRLAGSSVAVVSVIGFPHGHTLTAAKAYEAAAAVEAGASELDMVINLGALMAGDERLVADDIRAVVHSAGAGVPVKVILETALLSPEQKLRACQLAADGGAAFVKTSTGFAPAGGATVADVRLLRRCAGPHMGVKASGGIRTARDARAMLEAGATRLGCSRSVAIVT